MQFFCAFLSFLLCLLQIQGKITKTEIEARIIYNSDDTWTIVEEDFKDDVNYVATAYYSPSLEQTGWDTLAITTNKVFNDELQAEAAGRLEGHLTKERITYHYLNSLSMRGNKPLSNDVKKFLSLQEAFISTEYYYNKEDPHFYFAYLTFLQFDGLRKQYNSEVEPKDQINNTEFHYMASAADLADIETKYSSPKFDKMTADELENYILTHEHCSAIYKAKEDLSDIFFGHNTWHYYSMMNRIIKEMNFNFAHPLNKAKTIIFSSYPATFASVDDFYVTSQDLSVIETTNSFFNATLFKLIDHKSFPAWIRVMTANRMSENAEEWGKHFEQYNSGTYNNQWMTLDMKLVDLDKRIIHDKAFYITEQLPGYVAINDATDQLRYGYWPSYNTPFDKIVQKYSMIQETIDRHPEMASRLDYDTSSRAKIFRRDQSKIKNIEDFKKLMRYNNYTQEPFAEGSPVSTVSSRGDFKDYCGGAYDAKVGSVAEFKKSKTIYLISGPTDQDVPAFSWSSSKACEKYKREGLPDTPKNIWVPYTSKFIVDK